MFGMTDGAEVPTGLGGRAITCGIKGEALELGRGKRDPADQVS